MSFFACGCGTNSKLKRRAKSMTISELHSYKQKFRFADNELLEFRQRWVNAILHIPNWRLFSTFFLTLMLLYYIYLFQIVNLHRFNFLADTRGLIDKPSFIESMGVLGLDSGAFLSERIFKVMDNDMDGYVRV